MKTSPRFKLKVTLYRPRRAPPRGGIGLEARPTADSREKTWAGGQIGKRAVKSNQMRKRNQQEKKKEKEPGQPAGRHGSANDEAGRAGRAGEPERRGRRRGKATESPPVPAGSSASASGSESIVRI